MVSNMISHPRASNRRCCLVLVVRPDQIIRVNGKVLDKRGIHLLPDYKLAYEFKPT